METTVLGAEVARVRKQKSITQEELGRRVGLPKSSICKIETGRTRLTWEDAAILLEAMGETLAPPSSAESESPAAQDQKLQMLTSGIEWFARKNKVSLASAYKYLTLYKGLDFLKQNYRYEQTLPQEVILQDITAVCRKNGGQL